MEEAESKLKRSSYVETRMKKRERSLTEHSENTQVVKVALIEQIITRKPYKLVKAGIKFALIEQIFRTKMLDSP